jgi:hypothetical protein
LNSGLHNCKADALIAWASPLALFSLTVACTFSTSSMPKIYTFGLLMVSQRSCICTF